jgi:hypothetical protein
MIKEAGEVFLWDRELCSVEQEMESFRHWAQTAQTARNVNFNIQKSALSMISEDEGNYGMGTASQTAKGFLQGHLPTESGIIHQVCPMLVFDASSTSREGVVYWGQLSSKVRCGAFHGSPGRL